RTSKRPALPAASRAIRAWLERDDDAAGVTRETAALDPLPDRIRSRRPGCAKSRPAKRALVSACHEFSRSNPSATAVGEGWSLAEFDGIARLVRCIVATDRKGAKAEGTAVVRFSGLRFRCIKTPVAPAGRHAGDQRCAPGLSECFGGGKMRT